MAKIRLSSNYKSELDLFVKRLKSGDSELTENGWVFTPVRQPIYKMLADNGMMVLRKGELNTRMALSADRWSQDGKLTQMGLDYLIDKGFDIPENTPVEPTPESFEEDEE